MGEENPESGISRRAFLTAAALGAGVGALGFPLAPLAERAWGKGTLERIRAFEGSLESMGTERLILIVDGEQRVLETRPVTEYWRGGTVGREAFARGDTVLVRLVDGAVDHAWSNLHRAQGRVVRSRNGSCEISGPKSGGSEIVFTPNCEWSDPFTSKRIGPPGELPSGTGLDVIGLLDSGALHATKISVQPPGYATKNDHQARDHRSRGTSYKAADSGEVQSVVPLSSASPDTLCTVKYTGIATWFNCSNGAGRCGTCSTSLDNQVAYPALDACGRCSGSCCDCSLNCKNQVYKACGNAVTVIDSCSKKSKVCVVADCGPCQNCTGGCSVCVCSHTCSISGCTTQKAAVIDLTKPTFTYFRNPSSYGCFPTTLSVPTYC